MVKFLPPLVIGDADRQWIARAVDDVVADTQNVGGAIWDSARRSRRAAIKTKAGKIDPRIRDGGNGFMGSRIVRELSGAATTWTALVGADLDNRNLEGLASRRARSTCSTATACARRSRAASCSCTTRPATASGSRTRT